MCLLHMLLAVHDGEVGVLTIDHGLRREAADEVAMVAAAAEALGCRVHRAALALPPGGGVQERARSARIELAERIAAGHGYERIATGHTASDQAETVLFRIARGAGRSGALGIAARRGRFIRPLLRVTGTETRRWCREAGVTVVRDPSNRDLAYSRVRVRREFLPALERVHPSAAAHVASFADLLRDEDEVLTTVVEAAWTRTSHPAGGVDVVALRQEHPAMRRLLVRRLLTGAGLHGGALEREHVERCVEVAATGGRVSLPGGAGAAVERGRLVAFPGSPPAPAGATLEVPGRVDFGGVRVLAEPGIAPPPGADTVAVTDVGPLEVRGPRPGDRVPLAGGGRRAVGRLLADAGVPARLRDRVPVVACGDRVVWVVGHRAAADLLAPTGAPAVVLHRERAA